MSDIDNLADMGFDREKAALALKHGGNLQGALDYLEKNGDKTLEELQADAPPADPAPGEEARSLVCNECGKRFRTTAQAEFHASKTEHTDFAESAEELAPLTDEQKAAKLEELKARRDAKRADAAEADKAAQRRNEEIRRKSTKEQADAKADLEKRQQAKEAAKRKQEKLDDIEAKKRIQQRIAADKEERRRKAEMDKAARDGTALPGSTSSAAPVKTAAPAAPKPVSAYTEARLRLQTPSGTVQKNFPVETTLFEVVSAVSSEVGVPITSLVQTFPKKTWDSTDFGMTLKEAGLVPSAALQAKS